MKLMKREERTVCALTGHRDLPETFDKNALYDKLEEMIRLGCDTFLCGMAQGFDLAALECLADLRQRYPFSIEACIPYRGQREGLAFSKREQYERLLSWCDRKTELFPEYQNGCFFARDRYMVDRADVVLAYCLRETGGTAYTVRYARKRGVPVVFFG